MTATQLAIIAYPGSQQAAVLGLADLFTIANKLSEQRIEVQTLNADALPQLTFEAVLLPPNITGARGENDRKIHAFLVQQQALGCTLGSACAGAFWLGHAGVLNGYPVTTHWALEVEFTAAFPKAVLQPEHLLIEHHNLVTAGGMMAWVDLGLCFVERFLGYETAAETARHLLVDLRGREQRHYARFIPVLNHGDAAILTLQRWLETHFAEPIKVATMASRVAQSERSFCRKFKAATGLPPGAYLQSIRIEKARQLLEHGREPVSSIAWSVGYSDIPAFTRAFKAIIGLSPRAYRTRFNGS